MFFALHKKLISHSVIFQDVFSMVQWHEGTLKATLITGGINITSGLMCIAGKNHSFALIYGGNPVGLLIHQRTGLKAYIWSIVLLTAICKIPDGLMYYGIKEKKPGFLLPWLILYMILLVVSIA